MKRTRWWYLSVANYVITGTGWYGQDSITTQAASFTFSNVMAGHTYQHVCVGAIYPNSIGDPTTAPCVDIKLQ